MVKVTVEETLDVIARHCPRDDDDDDDSDDDDERDHDEDEDASSADDLEPGRETDEPVSRVAFG